MSKIPVFVGMFLNLGSGRVSDFVGRLVGMFEVNLAKKMSSEWENKAWKCKNRCKGVFEVKNSKKQLQLLGDSTKLNFTEWVRKTDHQPFINPTTDDPTNFDSQT